ncbi:DNA alkylation repair protein [Paenactinomyces guangxiensis]|uniref:DNA alkylation repair protein n=1 Tax=Paenactinomyces guangxiensis TaxID=1490290 RepID=A0A7W2A8X5_9BACL|nr:DNA alkylation repair protein [Paenactinomyces guangxiensis]MBA4494627.1 DNA alkylation repair protein [Paenactinomyces guangxiensis]MBH8591610.1 DNA alkylation repair protein [Paenactinomyces guangxiensis]
MSFPYLCPACGTNRSRFNIIEQVVQSVKKDAKTGEIIGRVDPSDPFQHPYRGEKYRVQCGVCGIVESEERFILNAKRNHLKADVFPNI